MWNKICECQWFQLRIPLDIHPCRSRSHWETDPRGPGDFRLNRINDINVKWRREMSRTNGRPVRKKSRSKSGEFYYWHGTRLRETGMPFFILLRLYAPWKYRGQIAAPANISNVKVTRCFPCLRLVTHGRDTHVRMTGNCILEESRRESRKKLATQLALSWTFLFFFKGIL